MLQKSLSFTAKIAVTLQRYIGDIEDRGKTGSVATLQKLAQALDITIDDLVA